MERVGVRVGSALAALLLVLGATACGGSSDDSAESETLSASPSDTAGSGSSGGDDESADDGDRNELEDALDQMGEGEAGECLTVGMAFFTLSLAPLGFMGGASEDDIAELQSQTEELRDEIPSAIRDDFDTYARGMERYASELKGTSLQDLLDPETQQKMEDAGEILDSPEMTEAAENIEAYFEEECPDAFAEAGSGS